MSTEYRAIWPTGDEVWQGYASDDREEFFKEFDELCLQLENLGVPKQGWPTVQCREVEIKATGWEGYGEYERKQKAPKHADTLPLDRPLVTSGPEYVNQGPIGGPQPARRGEITVTDGGKLEVRTPPFETRPTLDWQIVQVANHRFRFSDPCIVCAGDFAKCGHTPTDTQALISRIKREYHV